MLTRSLKPTLISAVIAIGVAVGFSTPSNAHNTDGGLKITGKHGQIHLTHGRGGHGYHGFHGKRHYGPPPHRYYRKHRHHHHYRHCGPRRAIDKAWRMGINRPHIGRIGDRRIVVKGRSHGRFAKVVFARRSSNCHVIGTYGLWRY